jgi:predicted acetyltransferase
MDIRPITPDEYVPFYSTFWRTMNFGAPSDEAVERDKKAFLYERSLAAFDDGDVVGTAHSHLFDLTLPGLKQVNAAGVTAISTASTHRRRGIITELKRRQLFEAHERGEAAAVLLASEGRIYGRFGYGAAAMCADIELRTKDTQFAAPNSGGHVRIVDGDTADKIFPAVFSAACRGRAGSIDRPSYFWESASAERDKRAVLIVFENPAGEATGYAQYRTNMDWELGGQPNGKLTIQEFVTVDDVTTLELWWYLLSLDLIRDVEAWNHPVDDPLRWVLAEPRALRTKAIRDRYWIRPLDVARLLSSRTYAADIDVTIEVADPLLGLGGTFALSGAPSGAECNRNGRAADVRMSISDHGAIILGGVAPSELARAGRIEAGAELLRRLDAAFVMSPSPWGATNF